MFEYAWEAIDDPTIQLEMKGLAPEAPPGSEDAVAAWKKITADLDFDGSDGSADMYAGKSLTEGHGGRARFLEDQIQVGGETDAAEILAAKRRAFFAAVRRGTPGMDNATFSERIAAWQEANPPPTTQ